MTYLFVSRAGDDGRWHEALPLVKTAYDVDKVIKQLEEKIVTVKILELVIIVNVIGVQEH